MRTPLLQDEVKIGCYMGRRQPPRGLTRLAVFVVLLIAWSVTGQTEVAMAQSSGGFESETNSASADSTATSAESTASSADSTATSEETTSSSEQSNSSSDESSSSSVVPTETPEATPTPSCSDGAQCDQGECCHEGQCVPTSCEACPNEHKCQGAGETCCARTKSCKSDKECKCGNCQIDAGEDCITCPADATCEQGDCCGAAGQCIPLGRDGSCNCEELAPASNPVVPQGC